MTTDPIRSRFDAWLESVPRERLNEIAREYSDALFRDGLAVYDGAADRFVPIPPTLTPQLVDDAAFGAFSRDARRLLEAAVRAAKWTLGNKRWCAELYSTFTPLEHAALADPSRLDLIATARVDAFGEPATAKVLELNATIPAMQGYSDIAARHWLRTIAAARGMDAAELLAGAGSNTDELLRSLVDHYHASGGTSELPSILIVSRRADAQLGELRHYERRWTAAGHRALHVWADEVELRDGALHARGDRFDLLYRHVFARRVEPQTPLAQLLVAPGRTIVRNPVSSPLEVKGLLAVLDEATRDDRFSAEIDLLPEHREALTRRIPWTRLLRPGPATLPDHSRVEDLVEWVAHHPEQIVLKRSWDYGGKSVVLGPAATDWDVLTRRAARDDNPWVAQQLVPPHVERHLLCGRDPSGRPEPRWTEVYVDLNAYTALGNRPPSGGVCRASGSPIVNILGGGGLAPMIPVSVFERLFP